MTKKYDSTVARIAGNIAGHLLDSMPLDTHTTIARTAVTLARAIVAEVERTTPLDTTPIDDIAVTGTLRRLTDRAFPKPEEPK